MKRVMVIGPPGSGKSTFARRLRAITRLPLHHLDQHYFRPGWQPTPKPEWQRFLTELAGREEWIMDGSYDSSFPIRMPRADTILWLDIPRRIAFPRILKRIAAGYGRTRADLAPGCPERIDWEFLAFAWTFRRAHAAIYGQALAEHAGHATVHVFARNRDAEQFLGTLPCPTPPAPK
jgi:adenylate kinase family enzyme